MPGTDKVYAIKPVERIRVVVPVKGMTPVIPHKFSEKAKRAIRQKEQKLGAPTGRTAKNPEQEAEDATYRTPNGEPGVPAIAFKNAMTSAAREFKGSGITMTALRTGLYLRGEGPDQLVPIKGEIVMREDPVKIGMSGMELRYRNSVQEWTADLDIEFTVSCLPNVESLLALLDAAGRVGVCDWRPEKNGIYGQFAVDRDRDSTEVAA